MVSKVEIAHVHGRRQLLPREGPVDVRDVHHLEHARAHDLPLTQPQRAELATHREREDAMGVDRPEDDWRVGDDGAEESLRLSQLFALRFVAPSRKDRPRHVDRVDQDAVHGAARVPDGLEERVVVLVLRRSVGRRVPQVELGGPRRLARRVHAVEQGDDVLYRHAMACVAERRPYDVLEVSGRQIRAVGELVDVPGTAQDGDGHRNFAEQPGELSARRLLLRGRLPVGFWVNRHARPLRSGYHGRRSSVRRSLPTKGAALSRACRRRRSDGLLPR